MKPSTKLEKDVVELSLKLSPITKKQISWGVKHCLDKFVHKSRKTLYCLECGHSWKDESIILSKESLCKCPSCKSKLKMYPEYKSYCQDAAYYAVITVVDQFQLIRLIHLSKTMQIKKTARYYDSEVMQNWIDSTGKVTTMAINVNGLSSQYDQWIFGSEMSIKRISSYYGNSAYMRFNLGPFKTYPIGTILPIFKRNGYNLQDCGVCPQRLLPLILNDQYAETLLKTNQLELLGYYTGSSQSKVTRWWPTIKICLRNNYIVKDASMWFDYLELLQYFHKDIHNAHYVCPKNFKEAHDLLMNKKREIMRKEQLIRDRELEIKRIEKAKKDIENYAIQKSKFFGMLFTDGKIKIKPLESVEEFKIEGDELEHCVYTNAYYNLKDSLIMSAQIDNKPIETIEISLKNFEIVQSRGLRNDPTEYHDRIIRLVRKNIKVIQERKSVKRQKIAV